MFFGIFAVLSIQTDYGLHLNSFETVIIMVTSTDKAFYSPKKIAEAIGVSESSLKRWCDKGLLRFSKTAGGHRRIFRADAIQFVRESETPLTKPEVLGLSELELTEELTTEVAIQSFEKALLNEDETAARKIVLSAFVQGWPLHRIFDDVIASAFNVLANFGKQSRSKFIKNDTAAR